MHIDSKKNVVLKTFSNFGYEVQRENEHIVLKNDAEGKVVSIPNHKRIKGSTLNKELTRLGVDKIEFFKMITNGGKRK